MRNLKLIAGTVLVVAGVIWLLARVGQFGEATPDFEKKWQFGDNELHSLQIQSDYPVELLFVKSTDGINFVHLKGQGKKQLADNVQKIELSGGTLDLDLRERDYNWFNFRIWNGPVKEKIIVSLTDESQIEQLSMKLTSGSIEARDVVVKTADIEVTSGSIRIRNLTADNLNLHMTSGSLNGDGIHANSDIRSSSGSIRLERLTGPAKVRSSSGSIKIYKEDTSDLDVEASSGSIYVRMPDSFAGIYDLRASSGSIRAPESKYQTKDLVKIRTSSGSIKIEEH